MGNLEELRDVEVVRRDFYGVEGKSEDGIVIGHVDERNVTAVSDPKLGELDFI